MSFLLSDYREQFENLGVVLHSTRVQGNQREKLILFDLYKWRENDRLMLGKEQRKIFKAVNPSRIYRIIDAKKS